MPGLHNAARREHGVAPCQTTFRPRKRCEGEQPTPTGRGGELLPPLVATLQVAALVKRGHRFIGRTRLDLHEVSTGMAALGALFLRRVHILPGSGASEHVVDILEPWILPARYLLLDVVHVRARVAGKAEAVQALLDQEDVGARWAKQEHCGVEMSLAFT